MFEPPAKRWHTREDSGIRLDASLHWWHDDERIEHPKIIDAFNRGLRPASNGRFELHFGNDWCFVLVEDAAYAVSHVDVQSNGQVNIELSDGSSEALDVGTLETNAAGILTCRVKDGRAKAQFTRDAQFALGERIDQTAEGWVLRIGTQATLLPSLHPAK